MLQYVVPILGFGFLGLSFLFVFLGFRNVQDVSKREDVDPQIIGLSRFFLKIALAFMVFAGPLQWATLAVQYYVEDKGVTLLVTMTHPEWAVERFGTVQIVDRGQMHPLINTPYEKVVRSNDEIHLNGSSVLERFREIQSQLTEINTAISSHPNSARSPSGVVEAHDTLMLEGG